MFAMLDAMSCKLVGNPHLHEICPEFASPILYLYYSHVVYFHILRGRAHAGTPSFTRSEQELLFKYERVAPADCWPIAAPLVDSIHAMGAHKPEESCYSWIVPSLPDFGRLEEKGLSGLQNVPGMLRLPVIPALQKLLRNFGTGAADYTEGILYPSALPLNENNQFIGISSSATDSPSFLAIAYNLCRRMPTESLNNEFTKTTFKRSRISRWSVPDVPNNATLKC